MVKVCPKCGREFTDSSVRCPICICGLLEYAFDNSESARQERLQRLSQKRETYGEKNRKVYNTVEQKKAGPSGISITALVFSLLGCLSIVGLILGIIDLCINKDRKRVCSILALVFSGIWVLVMIALFGGDGSGSGSRVRDSGNAKNTFGIMETAQSNNVKVTMTKYEESSGIEWNNPSSGNVFVLVEFEIENNSNSELAISSVLSFDAYVDNYAANYSLGALLEKQNETTLDGTIAAGMKMRGWIGWEVPADWGKIEVHFKADVWSGNTFKFLISK